MILSGDQIDSVLESVISAAPAASTAATGAFHSAIVNVLRPTPARVSHDVVFDKLNDMALPPELLLKIQPLTEAGFSIETAMAAGEDDNIERPYTLAVRADVRLALLHVPPEFFDLNNVWGSFERYVAFIDGQLKLVAPGRESYSPGFGGVLKRLNRNDEKRLQFIPWDWIEKLSKQTLAQVFELPVNRPGAGGGGVRLGELTNDDRTTIVDLLTKLAGSNPALMPRQILDQYIRAAEWPAQALDNFNWSNNARIDVDALVALAIRNRTFAANEARAGDTYLGALLLAVLSQYGKEDAGTLARLIIRYGLVTRGDKRALVEGYAK